MSPDQHAERDALPGADMCGGLVAGKCRLHGGTPPCPDADESCRGACLDHRSWHYLVPESVGGGFGWCIDCLRIVPSPEPGDA